MTGIGRVAIIGAGMAGLACARLLADAGAEVVVLDKGRGLGGRIATRRGAYGAVDHGAVALSAGGGACEHAPYTAGERAAFADYLRAAASQGAAEFWPPAGGWVGLPGMSGIVKPLARGLTVRGLCEVTGLERLADGWHLQGAEVPGEAFDQVVMAIPQPQAMGLLAPWPALQRELSAVQMHAVWTAMAWFAAPLPLRDDVIRPLARSIAKAIRTSAKPGRGEGEAWVLHADAAWTNAHLELGKPEAAEVLLAPFFADMGLTAVAPLQLEGHRWRYGLTATPLGRAFVRDETIGLSVCGDWCLGDSACDAYVSGSALAAAMIQ